MKRKRTKALPKGGAFSIAIKAVIVLVKCEFYETKDKAITTENCTTCLHWGGNRCKEEAFMRELYEGNRETEGLMRHDGYRRDRGGIRQIRRG